MIKFKGIVLGIAALLISGAAITETFAESFTVGDLTYTIQSDGENVSVKWNGTSTLVNIEIPTQVTNPSNSQTYTVKQVANNAFNGCQQLSEVVISDTVTTIGNYALFGGGYNGSECFNIVEAYDTSLTRSIQTSLSKKVYYLAATTIGNYALFGGGYIIDENPHHSSVVDVYTID